MIKVLVADDSQGFCGLVMDFLSGMRTVGGFGEYSVNCALTMESCKAKLRSDRPPDVVFLDLTFPDSSPDETLKDLKWMSKKAAFIVLTGHGYSYAQKAIQDSGAQYYLDKYDFIKILETGTVSTLIMNVLYQYSRIQELIKTHKNLLAQFEEMALRLEEDAA